MNSSHDNDKIDMYISSLIIDNEETHNKSELQKMR